MIEILISHQPLGTETAKRCFYVPIYSTKSNKLHCKLLFQDFADFFWLLYHFGKYTKTLYGNTLIVITTAL